MEKVIISRISLIQFLFKIDENAHWGPPSYPNTSSLSNSYLKFLKLLSGGHLLLQYSCLIQSLFKTDENTLWSLSPPPVHLPYSIHIQN
jgi:hypothetical protein